MTFIGALQFVHNCDPTPVNEADVGGEQIWDNQLIMIYTKTTAVACSSLKLWVFQICKIGLSSRLHFKL